MRKSIVLVVVLLLGFTSVGYAADFYAGGSFGMGQAADLETSIKAFLTAENCGQDWTDTKVELDRSNAFKAFVGYQIMDMLAVEGGFVNLGTLAGKVSGTAGEYGAAVIDLQTEVSGFSVAGVVTLPITDNFAAFARAGVFNWKFAYAEKAMYGEIDQSQPEKEFKGNSLTYGFGLSYQLFDGMAVRGEFERFSGLSLGYQEPVETGKKVTFESGVDVMSVGVVFSF